jgi:hypothetical protein
MRDKRGYETTYLMHWFRDGARNRSRVLYMFRTPGGVRVGRLPLDRDVLRQIEAQHPDIQFDWNAVRETQQIIEPAPEFRRRRPRRDDGETAQASPLASEPVVAVDPTPVNTPAPTAASVVSPAASQVPRLQVPPSIEGGSPDEQIAFLLKWHPLICERLAQRTADPERRVALLALAERLNPVAWTDADQITAGLVQAAEALERLSRVMARRRRRPRRSSGDRRGGAPAGSGGSGSVGSGEAGTSGAADASGPLDGPDELDAAGEPDESESDSSDDITSS